jgi:hypothetical protein
MAYAYYVPLVVQSGQVTGSVTDFVALLDHTFAPWKSVGNGGHIINTFSGYPADWNVFSDIGLTTPLDFEIIEWDATTGYILGWIQTPVATSTTVYIAYGDAAETVYQGNSIDTWTGVGFEAVYHMDTLSGSTWIDTTGPNPLTNTNGTAVTGWINDAGDFNGTTAYAKYAGGVVTTTPLTFSCWINPGSSLDSGYIVAASNTAGAANGFYLYQYSNGDVSAGVADSPSFIEAVVSGLSTNTWQHVAGVLASATSRTAYLNGSAGTTNTTSETPSLTVDNLVISAANAAGSVGEFLDATIDEVRVHDVARDAAWLEAEYNSQNDATAFWVLGSEQAVGGGASVVPMIMHSYRRRRVA